MRKSKFFNLTSGEWTAFFAGIFVGACIVFSCVSAFLLVPTPAPTNTPSPSNTLTPTSAPISSLAPSFTPFPSATHEVLPLPTDTPELEVCYIKISPTDKSLDVAIYLSVHGENALLFCAIAIESSDSDVEATTVNSIPDFPTWCIYNTGNGAEVEVISEYQVFGEAACNGLNSGTGDY